MGCRYRNLPPGWRWFGGRRCCFVLAGGGGWIPPVFAGGWACFWGLYLRRFVRELLFLDAKCGLAVGAGVMFCSVVAGTGGVGGINGYGFPLPGGRVPPLFLALVWAVLWVGYPSVLIVCWGLGCWTGDVPEDTPKGSMPLVAAGLSWAPSVPPLWGLCGLGSWRRSSRFLGGRHRAATLPFPSDCCFSCSKMGP